MSGELLGALGAPGTATPPGPPIYLIIEPVDMRLGIDGLSACIQTRLATSACSGGLYVFSNARKNRVKLLLWDGTGVWLAQRRLHQGSFTWPIPYIVLNLPVCTLILVSFFQSIPRDLENAAMIDGCTRFGTLWRVVLPLSAPGVFTAGILAFVNAWDEFLLALSLNSSAAMRTLPVGITLYQGEFTFPWPIIAAALVVAIVPVAIVIAIFQERVVGGLTAGGLKG